MIGDPESGQDFFDIFLGLYLSWFGENGTKKKNHRIIVIGEVHTFFFLGLYLLWFRENRMHKNSNKNHHIVVIGRPGHYFFEIFWAYTWADLVKMGRIKFQKQITVLWWLWVRTRFFWHFFGLILDLIWWKWGAWKFEKKSPYCGDWGSGHDVFGIFLGLYLSWLGENGAHKKS